MAAKRTTKLSEIPSFDAYFSKNKDELIKMMPPDDDIKQLLGSNAIANDINRKVSLYEGDITTLEVDGIVSASNPQLLSAGGISAAINKAAGDQLVEELKTMNGCPYGECKITPGYNLPAQYVIHAVGPKSKDGSVLERCYRSCLKEMLRKQMKSLAFCCISTGTFAFPNKIAAIIALVTVRQWLEELKTKQKLDEIDRIVFCLFAPKDVAAYKSWMPALFPCETKLEDFSHWIEALIKHKAHSLRPLPGFVELTTEPDMVTFDDNPDTLRARMPCGHVIGPETLTDYCTTILKSGRHVFECPHGDCKVKWPYFVVRHVACLTPEQMKDYETRVATNYLNKEQGTLRCPSCQIWCSRQDDGNNCVQCTVCTAAKGQPYLFCWKCLGEWNGGDGSTCGNPKCVGTDDRIRYLATCPEMMILDKFRAPSVRGCPKCGLLIEYLKWCTQMHCTGCDHNFCFLCLKGAKTKKELKCDPYQSNCTIAPRQTILPGM